MKIFFACFIILVFYSCTSADKKSISLDPAVIAKGETSFIHNCSSCHSFETDGIGPQLSGITRETSVDWLHSFINNPKGLVESGDKRAQALYKEYHIIMPSFSSLPKEEIDAIIAFLNTHQSKAKNSFATDSTALKDPIPDSIKLSDVVIDLKLITQFPASSDSGKMPLTRITKLNFQPNNHTPFVLDLRGKLYRLQNKQPFVYMDMARLRPKFINSPGLATGFGSFAFHPDFFSNGLLYTTHTEPPHTAKADFHYADSIPVTLQWVVMEWKADDPNAFSLSGKGRELFRVDMVKGIHGIQEIAFNPLAKKDDKDYGFLYVCVGDGGSAEEGYPFLVHDVESIWGTMLRIDPTGKNSSNGKYGIPPDNPFVKNENPKALKEIYAYGFRNPHRISWTQKGELLAVNIGQHNIESLYSIKPGDDCGWSIREGSFLVYPDHDINKVHPLPVDDNKYHITYPLAQYDHDEGNAISGGFEYTGKNLPELKGKYIFGDIPKGKLFYLEMADLKQGSYATIMEWRASINGVPETLRELCGRDRVDLHFGKDLNGELYILTKPDGKMYQLSRAAK